MKEQIIALAELEGLKPASYVRKLIEADIHEKRFMFERLAQVFKNAKGINVSSVTDEDRVSFMRIAHDLGVEHQTH